jgi:hypothetical protein
VFHFIIYRSLLLVASGFSVLGGILYTGAFVLRYSNNPTSPQNLSLPADSPMPTESDLKVGNGSLSLATSPMLLMYLVSIIMVSAG